MALEDLVSPREETKSIDQTLKVITPSPALSQGSEQDGLAEAWPHPHGDWPAARQASPAAVQPASRQQGPLPQAQERADGGAGQQQEEEEKEGQDREPAPGWQVMMWSNSRIYSNIIIYWYSRDKQTYGTLPTEQV